MQIFYINLDRRSDRRDFMEEQLGKIGLSGERVSAVTPDILSSDALRFCDPLRDRWVAPVELACTHSHRKVWRSIVDRGLPGALVLEDDVVLSTALPKRMNDIGHAMDRLDIVRLETRLMPVLIDGDQMGWLRRLYSYHYGAAGYSISRRAAQTMLEFSELDVPLDDLIFSPDGPMFNRLQVRQVFPGLCVTLDRLGKHGLAAAESDLAIQATARAKDLYRSHHTIGPRMVKHGARRLLGAVGSFSSQVFGKRRDADWRIVPFDEDDSVSSSYPATEC